MKIRVDSLDTLFSEYIRKRALRRTGGCERCLSSKTSWKLLQCSHFHGRGKKSVRWDEENAAGLCFGCHQYLTSHPLEHTDWFKKHLGETAFDLLNSRARSLEKVDKKLTELYFGEMLKGV